MARQAGRGLGGRSRHGSHVPIGTAGLVRCGTAGVACHVTTRLEAAGRRRRGMLVSVSHRRQGKSSRGKARSVEAGSSRTGGTSRLGGAGQAGRVSARHARPGSARQARFVLSWLGLVWIGTAGRVRQVGVSLGLAGKFSRDCEGKVRPGRLVLPRHVVARLVEVRQAGPVPECPGVARHGRQRRLDRAAPGASSQARSGRLVGSRFLKAWKAGSSGRVGDSEARRGAAGRQVWSCRGEAR
jgi:hypothetical protein